MAARDALRQLWAEAIRTDRKLQVAIDSISHSQQAVQRIIDITRRKEHNVFSLLGPILSNLKEAGEQLTHLSSSELSPKHSVKD